MHDTGVSKMLYKLDELKVETSQKSNYERLKEWVENGDIKLYYELSIPRSNSTAWQIAICEAPEIHGQLNEPSFHKDFKSRPFNSPYNESDRTFEEYFSRIVERLEGNKEKGKKGLLSDKSQKPVGIVVNDLVHSINQVELKAILRITNKITITIRDPRIQAHSVLTRIINDTLDEPGGGNISPRMALYLANKTEFSENELKNITGHGKDKVNPTSIMRFLKAPEGTLLTSLLLVTAIRQVIDCCCENYLDICWENLVQQINMINILATSDTNLVIIDGSDLTDNPANIMQQSAKALGLTYTPNMIHGWKKGTSDNFHCCITEGWGDFAMKNHWNGPVRNSVGLEKKHNSINELPGIEEFPRAMWPSIQRALCIYTKIANHKIKTLPSPYELSSSSKTTFPFINSNYECIQDFRLFKQFCKNFLEMNRHNDSSLQNEYDKKFGLVL